MNHNEVISLRGAGVVASGDIVYINSDGKAARLNTIKEKAIGVALHDFDGSESEGCVDIMPFGCGVALINVVGVDGLAPGSNIGIANGDYLASSSPGRRTIGRILGGEQIPQNGETWPVNVVLQNFVNDGTFASGGIDSTPPVITLLGETSYIINQGDSWSDPGFTATDDQDGDISGDVVVDMDGFDANVPGNYVITYNVTDSSGNAAATRLRGVTVRDVTVPVITLLGDPLIAITAGDPFTDPGVTAADNTDGDITGDVVVGGDTVDVNTPGSYTITYNVDDAAGNSAVEVTRTVTVAAQASYTLTKSLDFGTDADTDRISLQTFAPGSIIGEGDFSVSLWVKCTDAVHLSFSGLMYLGATGASNVFQIMLGNSNNSSPLDAKISSTIARKTNAFSGLENEWVHIGASRDSTNQAIRLYMDGVEVASVTGSAADNPLTDGEAVIGNVHAGVGFAYSFKGLISAASCWSGLLSAQDFVDLAALENPQNISGAGKTLLWNFDLEEGSGTTVSDTEGNHNGTILGNPTWVNDAPS